MARKTFEEAASEVAEKFSERGITLVEYEGTAKPCVINCPRHGNFRVSRYQQLFQSQSGGCKDCAKELTSAALESSRQAAQDVWNAYRMTKSVAGSNNIILNDVQGDTTINNHHTHTHNHSDADGKALSMRLTPRPCCQTVRRRLSPVQANSQAVSTCLHRWSPLHNIRLPLPCPTRPCRRLSKRGICWWSSRVCALRTKTSY